MKKTNCLVHGKRMYRVRAKIGEDLNGKPVYKSFYGNGKVEAEQKRNDYFSKAHSTYKTLGQLLQYYTYKVMPCEGLSAGTIEAYERPYRLYIKDSLISIRPLAELQPADLESFIGGLEISPSAVRATCKLLRRFFKWAYREGYCPLYNISTPRKAPQKPQNDHISIFSNEDIQLIIHTSNRLRFLFLLALSSGLREGELLALRFSDFKDGAVTVRHQLKEYYAIDSSGYRERTITIGDPKSRSSFRTVPLPDPVWAEYLSYIKERQLEQARNGYRSPYLFTTSTGNLLDRKDFRTAWKRRLKRAGVPYRKFHSCRATYCTLLCKNGVPLETAAKLMGHSDVSVTASFYRMVSDHELMEAADRLSGIFQPPSGDNVATLPEAIKKEQSQQP